MEKTFLNALRQGSMMHSKILKQSRMPGTEKEMRRIAFPIDEEVHFPLFYFILQNSFLLFFNYMEYTSLTKYFRNVAFI